MSDVEGPMSTASSMTPGSRPRRGVVGVLALLGVGVLTTAVVLAAGETADQGELAGAVELATFASCEDLATWGAEAMGGGGEASFEEGAPATTATFDQVGGEVDGDQGGDADVPMAAEAERAEEPTGAANEAGDAGSSGGSDGGSGGGSGGAVADETNVAVEGVDEIDLVDRLGEDVVLVASAGRLAVVDLAAAEVVEAATVPGDAQVTYDDASGVAWVVGHGDEGGVTVERFAADVEGLESEGVWRTVGGLVDARRVGTELHVVATDGFWAQPAVATSGGVAVDDGGWAEEEVPETTAPPAEDPIPFAGGPVPCDEVLRPEGPDPADPAATLLVTLPATGAVEPVRATEVVGSGSLVHVTTEAAYLATPQWAPDTGATTTGIHRFDLATLEPTGSGSVAGSLLDEFSMSEHEGVLRVAVTADGGGFAGGGDVGRPIPIEPPAVTGTIVEDGAVDDGAADDGVVEDDVVPLPEPVPPTEEGGALNEIVVLDTEGALDVVGRTEPFGHPGETLHGIRFAGTTAYAVTFLQTDPFYVVDLADPAAPQVVGEVELPGFSSYLHPLGDGLVVGFGPGEDGRPAAKLFDVSDPTAPRVTDELVLGDDSAVAYDHHAYVDLGDGRFAVPTTTYAEVSEGGVVVVDTSGGELQEEERHLVEGVESPTRVITADDGWALLTGPTIVVLDGAGEESARIAL